MTSHDSPSPSRPSLNSALLEARHVARRHPDGESWLLEDVSLRIEPGTQVLLAGPSGSGKTLLLRAMALLDPIDQGQVLWQGEAVGAEAIPGFRASAIYLHQRPSLLEEDVEAALKRPFSLATHRQRRFDRDAVVGWLEPLGRDASLLEKRCTDLSGGEREIVALVRALQLSPNILLLDEPTAALDPPTAEGVEKLLGDWLAEAPQSRALVWVTHRTEQGQRVADQTFRIRAGRIDHE